MSGGKRIAWYAAAGLAPYAITVFVDWGASNLATWKAGERFALLICTIFFLMVAWLIDISRDA